MRTDYARDALAHLASRSIRFAGDNHRVIDVATRVLRPLCAELDDALSEARRAQFALERHYLKVTTEKATPDRYLAVALHVPMVAAMFFPLGNLWTDIDAARQWRELLAVLPGAKSDKQCRFLKERERAVFVPWPLIDSEDMRARVEWAGGHES